MLTESAILQLQTADLKGRLSIALIKCLRSVHRFLFSVHCFSGIIPRDSTMLHFPITSSKCSLLYADFERMMIRLAKFGQRARPPRDMKTKVRTKGWENCRYNCISHLLISGPL